MKANQYRTGNLISPKVGDLEHIGQIIYISETEIGVNLIDDNFEEYLSYYQDLLIEKIEPIPLTEEWLFKFGYDLISENHYAFCGHLIWSIEDRFYCDKNGIQIKYVHKIQNLFFELKEEELTIKT